MISKLSKRSARSFSDLFSKVHKPLSRGNSNGPVKGLDQFTQQLTRRFTTASTAHGPLKSNRWFLFVAGGSLLSGSVLVLDSKKGSSSGGETSRVVGPKHLVANTNETFSLENNWVIKKYTAPVVAITAVNVLVFFAWRVPRLSIFMTKHFTSSWHNVVHKRRVHTLITSVFSHQGGFHLLFNTMCMTSLSPILVLIMGAPQFVGLYFGAGLFSSCTSIGFQRICGGLVARVGGTRALTAAHQVVSVPGLGASGSVFALLAISASIFPENRFVLLFLPMFPIEAGTLFPWLVAFDVTGCIYSFFRHSPIGHAAHLGGAAIGYAYYEYYLKNKNRAVRELRRRGIRRQ